MRVDEVKDYHIHVVEVDGRWAYIVEKKQHWLWDGFVSETLYYDKEQALAAGIEYVRSVL